VLQQEYGIRLPRPLLVEFSGLVQAFADSVAREVEAPEVWEIFRRQYLLQEKPLKLLKYWPRPDAEDPTHIQGEVHLEWDGKRHELKGSAQGPIAAFVRALRQLPLPWEFSLEEYEEDAIGTTADAEAITFVCLANPAGRRRYGIGFGVNIDQAAVRAIVSALNGLLLETAGATAG
jgi:2-isopropylmalate synthase